MEQVHVVVIAASMLLREGLQLILKSSACSLQGVSSIEQYLVHHGNTFPDIILWSGGMSFEDLQGEIHAVKTRLCVRKNIRLVALADVSSAATIRRLSTLDLDAVLSQDISGEVLQRSLELVMLGERLFPRARTTQRPVPVSLPSAGILSFPARAQPAEPPPAPAQANDVVLSVRESQILGQLIDGATNKLIARELHITEATVKVHVKGLLRKIRVTNRTQAAIWAMQNRHRVAEPLNAVSPSVGLRNPGR